MKKMKNYFYLILLLVILCHLSEAKKKQGKVDSVIVKNLKEHAKKARTEIKAIKAKIKPLKKWLKKNKVKWYPEQVYAKSILRAIKKKNKKIRKGLLTSLRKTHDKAELYRKTMGIKKKYTKYLYLYLYYLTINAAPQNEKYKEFLFDMAKNSNTLKKCVICYNLVRVLNFLSKPKYIERLKKKLAKAAGSKNKGLNVIKGLKPVMKNLINSGNAKDCFHDLFMNVKVVETLKLNLKSKTLYYQKMVVKVKKISVYKRRIRNIRHLYYRMTGAEEKREKEELKKQMTKFAKYRDLKIADLTKRKIRALAGILTLKKLLQKTEAQLDAITSLSFEEFLKKKNNNSN